VKIKRAVDKGRRGRTAGKIISHVEKKKKHEEKNGN